MRSTSPITLNLPHFSGATRKLILIHLAAFFGFAVLGWAAPSFYGLLAGYTVLVPQSVFHGLVWKLVTFVFFPVGFLNMAFAMLSLWFLGVWMEGTFGSRRLVELYLFTAVGAGLLASAITYTHIFGLRPDLVAAGPWAALMGLMTAFASLMGDSEMYVFFVIRMKAKYAVTVFILLQVAIVIQGGDRLGALAEVCGALCGWLYFRFSPTRGLAYGASERYFGLRNGYYRWKRRRAARKFEVYMRKQNRVVKFDEEGRYIAPEDERRNPKDKSWMN
ncbi:rhomboid family intramembrane serine protease [Terriglobus tenax]|uniref:rhomboid family intramembrane serine protease n=1 Tax=Terriglobus tenax TaxID=1111115 RepID=UPI0021DF5706|nr:rhomboid family intramembrane serine protease [Terriglobus tenax]